MLGALYKEHKQMNMYGIRSVSSTDVRNFYYQPSRIIIYHGRARSAITIPYQKSYYSEELMVVITEEDHVNHGGTASSNGQASHCHHCCACTQQRSMGDHHSGGVLVS